ncbi:hypothetical protein VU10_02360 [Desulfobulbus sp. US1]|nr:hypothetical protein [Desulfobulbus sp. US1]WLE97929.1 MAG: hypothetical protein QTN59_03625 [Candidatus Electrothrix communis]
MIAEYKSTKGGRLLSGMIRNAGVVAQKELVVGYGKLLAEGGMIYVGFKVP